MKPWQKAFYIISIFFLFYFFFGLSNFVNYGQVNNAQDFNFHFNRASGIDLNPNYPIGYNSIITAFGLISYETNFLFYSVNLFILAVLIPGLIFFVGKKRLWPMLIYFLGIPFFHQTLYSATYAQALIILFFLIYLNFRKNFLLLALLTILSFFIHGYGPYLFLLVLFAEISGMLFSKVKGLLAVGWMGPARLIGVRGLIELFLFQLPLPVLFFSLKKADLFYLILILFPIAFSYFDFRIISIAQIVCCVLCGLMISSSKKLVKRGFLLFLIFQGLFYLITYCDGTIKYIVLN